MKRLACLSLTAAMLMGSTQPSPAPFPVWGYLAIKCIGIGTIGATAVIIYRCEPDYYLIRVTQDDELPYWVVSQASAATVAKNEGWTRCEGPWKDRSEPDFRAWCNNHGDPRTPMFPCGPLGTIPNATHTNYTILNLQSSTDGGKSWTSIASTPLVEDEPNTTFVVLNSTAGTNGFTREEMDVLKGADAVATHVAAKSAMFRFVSQ